MSVRDTVGVDYRKLDDAIAKRVSVMKPHFEQRTVDEVAELIKKQNLMSFKLADDMPAPVRARLEDAFEVQGGFLQLAQPRMFAAKKRPAISDEKEVVVPGMAMPTKKAKKTVVFSDLVPPPPPPPPPVEEAFQLAPAEDSEQQQQQRLRAKIASNKERLDELTERVETASDKQRPFMEAETRRLQEEQQKLNRELKALTGNASTSSTVVSKSNLFEPPVVPAYYYTSANPKPDADDDVDDKLLPPPPKRHVENDDDDDDDDVTE
jgi:hypothetical protein